MIESLFSWLSSAMNSTPEVSLFAAFIWGILSIILSPCHLATIPLIVGFIDGQGKITTKRAFKISFLFSLGILITIGLVGVITAAMGRMMGDVGVIGNYFVALILIIIGLHLMDVIPLPLLGNIGQPRFRKKGMMAAFLLGLLYGIALGPCTFAYMAPVLTVALKIAATQAVFAGLLMLSYGIGHCSVIVIAGTFTEVVQHYLNWTEKSKGAVILRKICGLLLILAGIYMVWSA